MPLRQRHSATANVEYERGQTVLKGKICLEILRFGTRFTGRENPDAICDFMIRALLESEHQLCRGCSPKALSQTDSIAEALLIHEVDVVLRRVRVESREHHVIRCRQQLAAVFGLDPDDHSVVWSSQNMLHGR